MNNQQNQIGQVDAGKLGGPNDGSLVGKFIWGSAALSFTAIMEMYVAYSEAMNDWARTQKDLAITQQTIFEKQADDTREGTKHQAMGLYFQAGGAFAGVLSGVGSIVAAKVGDSMTSKAADHNSRMSQLASDVGAMKPGAGPTIMGKSRSDTPEFTSAVAGARENLVNKAGHKELIMDATTKPINKKTGKPELTSESKVDLDQIITRKGLDTAGNEVDVRFTLRDVLESGDLTPAEKAAMKKAIGDTASEAVTELYTKTKSTESTTSFISSLFSITDNVVKGGFKCGEGNETSGQAESQKNQNLDQAASQQSKQAYDSEVGIKEKVADSARDALKEVETLRQAEANIFRG